MDASQNKVGSQEHKLVARTLLVAPGLTTSNKKLLGTKGIATSSKDATRVHWLEASGGACLWKRSHAGGRNDGELPHMFKTRSLAPGLGDPGATDYLQ